MHLNHVSIFLSRKMIKTIVLSMAVTSIVVVTGCASKPQAKGGNRYVQQAPNYYTCLLYTSDAADERIV